MIQAKATFEVHKFLGIVLGKELNLTPVDGDRNIIGPIGERMRATVTSYETRHALARETLLQSLQPADLLRLPYNSTGTYACPQNFKDQTRKYSSTCA